MNGRPRLLFISQTLPFPPDGGVKIRTYNILRLLARDFEVTALCFYRWKGGVITTDLEGSLDALREFGRIEAFPIPQEHSRSRLLWDHLRSVALGRTYTVFSYESAAFRARLRDLLEREDFDIVHSDSLDLSGYFPELEHLPLVCVHHDVQSILLSRRAGLEASAPRRMYMRHQSRLMEAEERRWCGRVALNVVVSPLDQRSLETVVPCRTLEVPNGVDTDYFTPEVGADEGAVFVGGTTWFPNKDALEYFSQEIYPLLRQSGVHAPIRWVGRASASEQQRHGALPGLDLTGHVPDIRPYVRDAACYIVPLRVGGGTRVKILDAWGMGKAVVSTSVGCEGLAAVDGENILIRDDPREFAEAVAQVLADPGLRDRIGRGARRTAEQRYSWDIIGESMNREYKRLLRGGSARLQPRGRRMPVTG